MAFFNNMQGSIVDAVRKVDAAVKAQAQEKAKADAVQTRINAQQKSLEQAQQRAQQQAAAKAALQAQAQAKAAAQAKAQAAAQAAAQRRAQEEQIRKQAKLDAQALAEKQRQDAIRARALQPQPPVRDPKLIKSDEGVTYMQPTPKPSFTPTRPPLGKDDGFYGSPEYDAYRKSTEGSFQSADMQYDPISGEYGSSTLNQAKADAYKKYQQNNPNGLPKITLPPPPRNPFGNPQSSLGQMGQSNSPSTTSAAPTTAPANAPQAAAPTNLGSDFANQMQKFKKGGQVKVAQDTKKKYTSGGKINLNECRVSTAQKNKKNSNW